MQTHGGVEAEAAILSTHKSMRAEIKVDWFRNGAYAHFLTDLSPYVDNISVDRSLSGAAPSEIMLIEGSAAAELSFELGGFLPSGPYGSLILTEPMNFVGVFSPYNGVSPMYNIDPVGAEVTYRLGIDTVIGTIWYQQFVGNIRTITPTRRDNKVVFTALDRVEKLRKPITITDWGILDLQANQGRITSQLMGSHWVIDHCLKNCDVSSSPYRWPSLEELPASQGQVEFSLSGNGGIAPNVGWVDGSYLNQFPNTDVNPALTMYQERGQAHPSSPDPDMRPQILRAQRDWGDDANLYWTADKDRTLALASHTITFTLHTESYAGSEWFATMADAPILALDPKDDREIQVWVGDGEMWLRYIDPQVSFDGVSPKIPIPTGAGNEYVRCSAQIQYGFGGGTAGERMRLTVGATTGAWVNMKLLRGWIMYPNVGLVRLWRELAIQDICITGHTNFTPPTHANNPAKYVGVLDRGLNQLSFLPKRWGNLAWDVITEAAAAEFGAVHWDELGVFRFWNQDTILGKKDDFVRTFTLDEVSGLEITNSTDSIRNIYSIAVKKSRVQSVRTFETTGPDEIYLNPSDWTDFRLWIDGVVTPNSGQPPTYEPEGGLTDLPEWNELVNFGVLPQRLVAGVWTDTAVTGPWLSSMYRRADGSTQLTMWNGFGEPVRFADPNGGPAFRWDGSKLTAFDDQVFEMRDTASVTRWGPQGLELSSDWYQEFFDYGSFFSKILARTNKPIPTTQNIEVSGDPRIQLGDAIKVFDPQGMGEDMQLQILGINRRFSKDSGLVDSYTVEMTQPPRIGIWDSAQYGVWDASFIWSA